MKESANIALEQGNDEIDLVEIIRVLWDKKLLIILTTFITTLLAGIYAFTAKEQWTSRVTVVAPKVAELGSYLDVRREYNRILRIDPIDPKTLSDNLFAYFNSVVNSSDERNEFFIGSDLYNRLIKDKDEEFKRKTLFHLSRNASKVKVYASKSSLDEISIAFSAEMPKEAKDTLMQLINFISDKSFKLELKDFLAEFQNMLVGLRHEKSLIEQEITKIKNSEPGALRTELSLADDSYLFMLSGKYFNMQKYYELDFQLKQLESLLEKAKDVTVKSYSDPDSQDYLTSKDKPKRLWILIIGFILGLMISTMGIIFYTTLNRVK